MLVKIKNLNTEKQSIPLPSNISIQLKPNQVVGLEWIGAEKSQFDAARSSGFSVETLNQLSDITVPDGIDVSEVEEITNNIDKLITGTIICDDNGSHVSKDDKWTTSESRNNLVKAYQEALEAISKVAPEEGIESITQSLNDAVSAFEGSLLPGIILDDESLDTSKAIEAMDDAELELSRTSISETGEDVTDGNGWYTSQDNVNTLLDAKKTCIEAISEAEDQGTIDSAVTTLESAIETFDSSRNVVNLIKVSVPEPDTPISNKTVSDLQDIELAETAITGTVHKVENFKVGKASLNGYYMYLDIAPTDKNKVRISPTYKSKNAVLGMVGGLDEGLLLPVLKNMEGCQLVVKQTNVGTKGAVETVTYDVSGVSIDSE